MRAQSFEWRRSWQRVWLWALELFCEEVLQDHHVEGLVGDELLEFVIFVLDQPEAFGFVDFQATELVAPLVEGGLADAVPPTEFGDGCASFMLFEDLDDLFFGMSCFHG